MIKVQNINDTVSKINTINKIKILVKRLSIKYPNKQNYNSVIPKLIYQTWHTRNLPPKMKSSVQSIINNNPKFNHFLFDDSDCREFIKNNFNVEVLNAFDNLIPGAYKADLWRYCILYKTGGIYLDIKYKSHNNFKFINLTENEHFVIDVNPHAVYNAVMVCKKENPKLLEAINKIVYNVQNKNYNVGALGISGPELLGSIFTQDEKNTFDMKHEYIFNEKFVTLNNIIIICMYNSYYEEIKNNQTVARYDDLFNNRQVYK